MKNCVRTLSAAIGRVPCVALALLGVSCAGGGIEGESWSGENSSTTSLPSTSAGAAAGGATTPQPTLGGGATPPSATSEGSPNPDETGGAMGDVADAVPPTSRLLRLSHQQFDRVLSDLLGLDVDVTRDFPEEVPTLGGYFEEAALTVNDRLKTELAATAERLAATLVTTPEAYQKVVGCETTEATCRDAFVTAFIGRTYRRPITEGERTAYTSLFDRAAELVGTGDAFRDGVQLVVEAALQSPQFLYRVEVGSGETDEFGVRLTPHEVASRLSFMLWGTMPDDELFAAATDGSLLTTAGFDRQLERLLNDPRVAERSLDFHERWLQLESLSGVTKDAELYPLFDGGLVESMREETRLFVENVTIQTSGGIVELLTAPFGFVNDDLNGVYGFDGAFGSDFSRVDYSAQSPRGGLLTQAAFLSGHSSSATTTSPILRGTFVLRRLTCLDIPEPPANAVSQTPPAPAQAPVTTRDLFTWKTSMAECSSCHALINPVGFAFEEFDAVGRHRTEENGAPVDASGQLQTPTMLSFTGAKDLSAQLATLPETAACYASNWLEYAYGRPLTSADAKTLADLASSLRSPGFGAKNTLERLARSAAFTHISPQ